MENHQLKSLQYSLVTTLKAKNYISSQAVEYAFLKVPRHTFLPDTDIQTVYSDVVISTKLNEHGIAISSSSQPAAMAIMLEQLCLNNGDKVLEIGTGTGFNAALMAEIVGKSGHVVTIDVDNDITDFARKSIASAGYENVTVICGDGFAGYNEFAPYDKIIFTVAAWDITADLINQLKHHGLLVVPYYIRISQKTICYEKVDTHLESRTINNCIFMPCRGEHAMPTLQQVLVNNEITLSTCLLSNELVDKEKTLQLLSSNANEYFTGIKVTAKEILSSLFFWLDSRKPNICAIYMSAQESKRLHLNLIPSTYSATIGLINQDCISLMVFASSEIDIKNQSNEILIKQFGNDDDLSKELIDSIVAWDKAGRTSINDTDLKLILNSKDYIHNQNELLIPKKWTTLFYNNQTL